MCMLDYGDIGLHVNSVHPDINTVDLKRFRDSFTISLGKRLLAVYENHTLGISLYNNF